MKKITHFLFFLSLVVAFNACDEENYKDINISHNDEDIDVKAFVGDLTAQIVIANLAGESITNIDMGESFYVIDNTEGGSDQREWTITQGDMTVTSIDQLVRLNFKKPGTVVIKLTSVRSSDGESVSSETNFQINVIPVMADFKTDIAPGEDGVITIKTGDYIAFEDNSVGSPDLYEWIFEGGNPGTGTERSSDIRYESPGLFGVTLKASREDNPGEFVSDQILKTGLIHVIQREVKLLRAVATDNKIELQFTEPVAQEIAEEAIGEFSLTISTNGGAVLTPTITALTATGDSAVTLTFNDKVYSDDEALITFNPTGLFMDATGLTMPEAFVDEPCVYGYNLLNGGSCDEENYWETATAFPNGSWSYSYTDSYQGIGALHLENYTGTIAVVHSAPFEIKKGVQYVIKSHVKYLSGSKNNNLSVRITDVKLSGGFINDKSNGLNQLWGNLSGYTTDWSVKNWNAGKGWAVNNNLYYTGTFDTSEVYLAFFFQDNAGGDAEVLIDNVLVCEYNPRP